MFGRPLTAAQILSSGNIVLAVGARNPARILIYELDPASGTVILPLPPTPASPAMAVVQLEDVPRKMVTAQLNLNVDSIPDFVVAGFGPVEVLLSLGNCPIGI